MYRCFTALLCLFLSSTMIAQTQTFEGLQLQDQSWQELEEQFKSYQTFELDITELNAAVKGPNPKLQFQLKLGDQHSWDLELIPNDLRGPNYFIQTASGTGQTISNPDEVITFRGFVKGDQFSEVRMTIEDDFLYGYIKQGEEFIFFEPLRYFVKGAPVDRIVVYDAKNVQPKNATCGFSELQKNTEIHTPDVSPTQNASQGINCYEVEVAIASDFSMFQKYGSTGGVSAHNLGVLNNVQGNYDDEFEDEIVFVVVTEFFSDCSTCDPWTTSNNAGTLLDSFRSWGNAGNFGVTYDVASIWTNRDFNGSTIGVAWLSAICNSLRYNALQDFTSNANFLRVLTSHELGHNFSSVHDAGGSPFIMAPSVQNTSTWSPSSILQIDNYIDNRANVPNCFTSCSSSIPPIADFEADVTSGCIPMQVNFFDLSQNDPATYTWSFPGGNPTTSSDVNPSVVYTTPGIYDVTLVVTNSAGTDVMTKFDYIEVLDFPVADFDFTISGLNVFFNDLSQNATDYDWDFGDGGGSAQASPFYTYAMDGVYTVTLVTTNACGTSIHTEEVTIITPPLPDFEANPTIGCAPLQVFFIDRSTLNTTDWNWTFSGGTPSTSVEQFPTITYNTPGVYDVTLEVSNASGGNVLTRTAYIEVLETATAGFTHSTTASTTVFTNTSTSASSYLWDFGDGNTSVDVDPIHTYAMDGTYFVDLTAFGICDTLIHTDTVVISNLPIANIDSDVITGCVPQTVQYFNNTTSNVTAWSWTFPGGTPATSTDENPTVTYNSAGVFDVTLMVSNAAGSDTETITNYMTIEDVPNTSFTSSTSGTTTTFTNTSSNATTYNWDFGDGNNSSDVDPVHTYATDGVYTVVLTATNNCGTSTAQEVITIVTLPTAGATGDITSGCAALTVQFTDQSSSNATSWSWTFPGGNPGTSTDQNPTVTYNTAGTYDVLLTVSNAAGSDNITLSNYITVDDVPSVAFSSSTSGRTVTFTNTSTNANSYSWDFGDGNSSADTNPVHTYASDGTYTVVLTATNNCGTASDQEVLTISTLPTAGATGNVTSGCAALTVQFTDQSSSNATSWSWTFPGGNPGTSTDQNPTVTYNTAGTYDVLLTVSNAAGSDNITLSNYITVDDVPSVAFSSSTSGRTVTFTNTSTNATSYNWDFGDGNSSADTNPVHTYASDGTYTVVLTATNNCGTASDQEVLTISTLPTAGATGNVTSGCAALTVQFTDQSSSNATSWSWTFPGGNPGTSTVQNPTVVYNTAGTYDVMLTVSNATGSDNITLSNYISVDDVPNVSFSSSVNGATVTFTNTSTNANSYSWDFGDGNSSMDTNPVHTYASDGPYTVVLTATNNCGTTTSSDVINIGTIPNAGATADVTSGCVPLVVQFTDQSSANTTSWSWTFPGGTPGTSTVQNPTVTYNTAGTYDVMLTVSNSAGSDNITLSNYISVDDVPSVAFSSSTNDRTVTFTNTSTNATTYSWDFGDGNSSMDTNPVHTYATDDIYTVVLTATNNCGTASDQEVLTISTSPMAGATASTTTGCVPFTVQFSNQSSANTTAWSWTFPGGTPGTSSDENPVVTYNMAGTYDVLLSVSNAAGTDNITLSNYITVQDVPMAGFSSSQSGTTVDFTNSSTNATTYSWDFGDGNSSAESNPSHTYASDGVYTVVLMATNACGTVSSTEVVTVVTNPVAGFTTNLTTGCAPLMVQFTDQSSSNATAWSWTFPGGMPATSTDQNPVVTYANGGTFDVTLSVSNAAGTDQVVELSYITVQPQAVPDFTTQQMDLTVDFTNTSTNATSYSWAFGDGNTSMMENPSHTYLMEGSYDVVLTVTNNCGSQNYTQTVDVSLSPLAGFTANVESGCAPLTVQFSDESSGNGVTAWSWNFPGGTPATSTDQNPMVVYNTPGTFDVSLEITSGAGTNMAQQVAFIEVLSTPSVGFTSTPNGTTVDFLNTTSNATSYSWDFGDSNTSNEENPSHTYATDGTYTVTLTATNECGDVVMTETVTVTSAPTGGFSAMMTTGCAPFMVDFIDESSDNTTSWSWTFEGGTPGASTEQNPSILYSTPGTYTVTLEVSNSAGSNSITQVSYITVLAEPTAAFNSSVTDNQVTFQNMSTGASSYLWDFGDGNTSMEINPVHVYSANGDYVVVLTVTNICGTKTFTETISIETVTLPQSKFTAQVTEGCAPLEVQFTNESSGNSDSWSWTFPGGVPGTSTEENPIVTYNIAGEFPVTLIASNSAGADTTTVMDYITILGKPTSDFTSSTNNLSVDFVNTSTDATSYLWGFGDGNTSIEENPTHVYAAEGSYDVLLVATNDCGSANYTVTINVMEGATAPTAMFTSDATTGCVPLTVQYTDMSTGNPTSWNWTFEGGDPATSTDQNPIVIYNQAGIFEVVLEVTNGVGTNTATSTDYIKVEEAPVSSFTYLGDMATYQFTNTSVGGNSYLWDFGDGNTSTEVNPSHTFTTSNVFDVVLTVTNDCGEVSFTETIEVIISDTENPDFVQSLELFPNPNTGEFVMILQGLAVKNLDLKVINVLGQTVSQKQISFNGYLREVFDLTQEPAGVYLIQLRSEGEVTYRKVVVE